jgi:hypothetical protein
MIALDAQGRGIKRMHAAISVRPGESLGCIGCHEERTKAPAPYAPRQALQRPPSRLVPELGVPTDKIVDYLRVVQPIFDRHCVSCHNSDRWNGRLNLDNHRNGSYAMGAFVPVWRGLISLPGNFTYGDNWPINKYGSPASPLLAKMDGTHHGAKPSLEERRLMQIWVDGGGLYAPTHAVNDNGIMPERKTPASCLDCHKKSEAYKKRHGQDGPHAIRRSTFPGWDGIVFDYTEPSKSLLIRAPLAESAGGLGWCRDAQGKPVFTSRDDPDFKKLLALLPSGPPNSIERPDFQPHPNYFGMMRQYGVLPSGFDPGKAKFDLPRLIALDEAYYRLFQPGPSSTNSIGRKP